MVGLVLDGGSAFAQRRDEQSAADLAALAGANDYMLNSDTALGDDPCPHRRRGQRVHARRRTASSSTSRITTTNGAEAQVDISAPHRNNFASIVGMPTWTVATTAKAQAGYPDTANGAGPDHLQHRRFRADGPAQAAYGDPDHPYDFGETNGDIPSGPGDIAWTNYGHRQRRLQRRPGHHHGRQRHQQDDRLRRVHRPAQQRQPHARCSAT